jgi:hypothetical protein
VACWSVLVSRIGRNFAIWAIFYGVGQIFFAQIIGLLFEILAKFWAIDLNKAKILFEKRFFTCFSKIFRKFYLLFYVKKTIKECPVPLDISIKSNRKHHKTVLYRKTNKNMFGRFFIVFGRFFNKNIWSPCRSVWVEY